VRSSLPMLTHVGSIVTPFYVRKGYPGFWGSLASVIFWVRHALGTPLIISINNRESEVLKLFIKSFSCG